MFQHDKTQPHVVWTCPQFLEAENVPVLPWPYSPAYSPDMSPIEHIWDALDRVPVHANIQQLCTAIEEEWDNIPQATINSLITLHEANSGHTRY